MVRAKYSELFEIQPDPYDTSCTKPLKCRVALFTEVNNGAELKAMLEKNELQCALIKAELVLEVFQLLAAANRAVSCQAHDKMSTKSIYSEILYSLSPTKNITESLQTFGIADDSANIVAVTVGEDSGKHLSTAAKKIKGKCVPLKELKQFGNYDLAKQVYHVRDPELNKGTIIDAIVSRMVSKDYIS